MYQQRAAVASVQQRHAGALRRAARLVRGVVIAYPYSLGLEGEWAMRFISLLALPLAAAACVTTPTQQAAGPAPGKWKNEINGANLNADYCVKAPTTFKEFFLGNQAPGSASCSDASFLAQDDGALLGQAYCTSGGQGFMVHIRVTGDLASSYAVQSVVAPLGAKIDFSSQPSVVSTRMGDC